MMKFFSFTAKVIAAGAMVTLSSFSALGQAPIITEGYVAHAMDDIVSPFNPGEYGNLGAGRTVGVVGRAVEKAKWDALREADSEFAAELPGPSSQQLINLNPSDFLSATDVRVGSDTPLHVLQVLHDMAPAATLVFTALEPVESGGQPDQQSAFIAALERLKTHGVDVVVDVAGQLEESMSVQGRYDEPTLYDGPAAVAVAELAKEVLYVIPAGTLGNLTKDSSSPVYEGNFARVAIPDAVRTELNGITGADYRYLESAHDFGTDDPFLTISEDLERLCIEWSDMPNGSVNDYELLILDASGAFITIADAFQFAGGGHEPVECIVDAGFVGGQGSATQLKQGHQVMIVTDNVASEDQFFSLRGKSASGSKTNLFEKTTDGVIYGRAAVDDVVTVASAQVDFNTTGAKEPRQFSANSQLVDHTTSGNRSIHHSYASDPQDGVSYTMLPTPQVRMTPDLVGATGVRVVSFDRQGAKTKQLIDDDALGAAHIAGMSAAMSTYVGDAALPAWDMVNALVGGALTITDTGITSLLAKEGVPLAINSVDSLWLPLPVGDVNVVVGFNSYVVTFSLAPDLGVNGAYSLDCTATDPDGVGDPYPTGSISLDLDGPLTTVDNGVVTRRVGPVPPGYVVTCSVAVANEFDETSTAEGSTPDGETVRQALPTYEARPDAEGFTLSFTVDSELAQYLFHSLSCQKDTDGSLPGSAGGYYPDSVNADNADEVEIDQSASSAILANNQGFYDMDPESTYTCQVNWGYGETITSLVIFDTSDPFVVLPDPLSSGLPIWLLYEASKTTAAPE